jgi:hypothetical protein
MIYLLNSRLRVAMRRRKWPAIQQKNEWTQKWPYEKDALAKIFMYTNYKEYENNEKT